MARKRAEREKVRKASPEAMRFLNRDSSWLNFNRRVLEEAEDTSNPLLERVKFLAITASNLDEFVEIRLAGLLQRIEDGYTEPGIDGLTPQQTLENLTADMHAFVLSQYEAWNKLRVELEHKRIRVLHASELRGKAQEFAKHFYQQEVDPLLTPITIDPAHPFPRVLNKALCVALMLRRRRKGLSSPVLGVITVPRALPRLVKLPSQEGFYDFIQLQDLIELNAPSMYRGYGVLSHAAFRVTRNSNLYFEEEETRSLLESVRAELHNRRKGDAVRLEIVQDADPEIVERLQTNFELDQSQIFQVDGPVNLSRILTLHAQIPQPALKYAPFTPKVLHLPRKATDLFDDLRQRDILLHHPYDSYDAVEGFIKSAVEDERVVTIKQTLYRTSSDSSMFRALTEAAQEKEVTVVVELTARFDEASNIRWARALEDAGVQVFHGLVGLKTHCKMAMLVRHDPDGVTRRYCHIGTGNYNPNTARFYTDLSLMTSNPLITERVHAVFNYLTAHAEVDNYEPLLVAPLSMAQNFIRMIRREEEYARAGRPAHIIAKMNALLEPSLIEALYSASNAGVEIDLIIRGMCALRPGVKGMSERIRVRSIVGRFLEHSRIFYFSNNGKSEVYIGSADWMPRNLFERCEVVVPILDPVLRERLRSEILAAQLADTARARIMQPDGSYLRAAPRADTMQSHADSQTFLMKLAEGKEVVTDLPRNVRQDDKQRAK